LGSLFCIHLRVESMKTLYQDFKRELAVYRLVAKHERTPRVPKWLLGAAIGYLLLPFDLIPDFIPVLGQVDDVLIVPGLVWLALRCIPPDVIEECRAVVGGEEIFEM
jgi:uncharacterized membrane protein YkvA (DUF1232 family)